MNEIKERLYITAIINLIKQLNSRELFDALEVGEITEQQYEDILMKKSCQYVIDIKNAKNLDELIPLILNITEKIGLLNLQPSVSVDDVSTMFGISSCQLGKYIERYIKEKQNPSQLELKFEYNV